MKTARDTVVTLHYTLTDERGEVLDSSTGGEPLTYLHGHGNLVPGLERALEGASAGHTAKVSVHAADGYGEHNPELVFDAPREHFPSNMTLKVGERVHAEGPNGAIPLMIVQVTEKGAILDGNHPLAGQTLHFDIQVITVRAATQEEIAHGHVHGSGGHHH